MLNFSKNIDKNLFVSLVMGLGKYKDINDIDLKLLRSFNKKNLKFNFSNLFRLKQVKKLKNIRKSLTNNFFLDSTKSFSKKRYYGSSLNMLYSLITSIIDIRFNFRNIFVYQLNFYKNLFVRLNFDLKNKNFRTIARKKEFQLRIYKTIS